MTHHVAEFFEAISRISAEIDGAVIDRLAHELAALRERRGRLFLLGVGGSAGNCSHAVNDFRKRFLLESWGALRRFGIRSLWQRNQVERGRD